jgi:hypothetical protein
VDHIHASGWPTDCARTAHGAANRANFVQHARTRNVHQLTTSAIRGSFAGAPSRAWDNSALSVLLLDERITPDGAHARTWATSDGERLQIRDDDGWSGELSLIAVDQVMYRYGRPLDDTIALEGDSLLCGACTLRRLRHHAVVDVEGRDYLVWQRAGDAPMVCLAATVTAALRFLVARAARKTTSGI